MGDFKLICKSWAEHIIAILILINSLVPIGIGLLCGLNIKIEINGA